MAASSSGLEGPSGSDVWLESCRRAAQGLRDVLREHPTSAQRVIETGKVGEGGDRTLVIDRLAEDQVFGELERLHGLIREFNARLLEAKDRAAEALSVKAIDTVLAESINRASLRPIDADGIGARAREAREAAVRARRDAANHLRHSITAWKSSYRAIEKQLSTDEKSVARAMASRVKPMAAPPALKALKPPARPMHEKPPPPIADAGGALDHSGRGRGGGVPGQPAQA